MTTDAAKALGRLGAPTIVVSLREFRGHLAHWAVRMSPYPQGPDGLSAVLLEVNRRFAEKGFATPARVSLEAFVQELLFDIPQVKAWNARKNGRDGLGFTSAFEPEHDPDDEFIDLYALARNIAASIVAEERE